MANALRIALRETECESTSRVVRPLRAFVFGRPCQKMVRTKNVHSKEGGALWLYAHPSLFSEDEWEITMEPTRALTPEKLEEAQEKIPSILRAIEAELGIRCVQLANVPKYK